MEYTPPEETNRRQRQREIETEREREQKVPQLIQFLLVVIFAHTLSSLSKPVCLVCCASCTVLTVQHCTWHRALRQPFQWVRPNSLHCSHVLTCQGAHADEG